MEGYQDLAMAGHYGEENIFLSETPQGIAGQVCAGMLQSTLNHALKAKRISRQIPTLQTC
jgi:hypothetical protein